MDAALQVLSPLVPVREVNFLRFCKQHAEGVWAVVDVSVDTIRESQGGGAPFPICRRLPSGCLVQDMPNGYSKVTIISILLPCYLLHNSILVFIFFFFVYAHLLSPSLHLPLC